ncbi:MAG TPA: hypothetical protein DD670_12685 [Planctomycetaceae bacterium]|nr:hypothetical protein [Planctomycetaceae bacterium]
MCYACVWQQLKECAVQAYRNDCLAAAVELLRPYVVRRPEDGYAWFVYGDVLRRMGLSLEAIAAFGKAIEFAPDDSLADVHIQMGKTCNSIGEFAEAERHYAAATKHDPGFERGWLWIFRGCNLARSGEFARALSCYLKAVEIGYNVKEAYLNIGYALRAQGNYDSAADAFRKAMSLTPDCKEAKEGLLSLEGVEKACSMVQAAGRTNREAEKGDTSNYYDGYPFDSSSY